MSRYLQNPVLVTTGDILFTMPSKTTLMKTAHSLCERLFVTTEPQLDEENEPAAGSLTEGSQTQVEGEPRTPSLQERLQEEINQCMRGPDVVEKTGTDLQKILAKEFALYESTKVRPENLNRLYLALGTIQPTSVEAERAFSVCGQFVTKIRNRLSKESINALCILKAHFLKNKKK